MLMYVPTGIFLLGVIDKVVHIALERAVTAGRVRIEPTARVHGEVRCLLDRLDGKVPRRLDDDTSLATDPGDDRGPILVVMAPTGLTLLAATTRAATQGLLPTLLGLPFVAGDMVEVIRFHRGCQLTVHLIGQGRIAQPPAPAVAGPALDAELSGNPS